MNVVHKLSVPLTGIAPPLTDTVDGPVAWDSSSRGGILCAASQLPLFLTMAFVVSRWRMTGSFPTSIDDDGNPEFSDVDITLNSYYDGLVTPAIANEYRIIGNNIFSYGPSDEEEALLYSAYAFSGFHVFPNSDPPILDFNRDPNDIFQLDVRFPSAFITPFAVRGKMFLPSIFYGRSQYGDIRTGIVGTADADDFEETAIVVQFLGTSIELPAFSFRDPGNPGDFTPRDVEFEAIQYFTYGGRFNASTGAPV